MVPRPVRTASRVPRARRSTERALTPISAASITGGSSLAGLAFELACALSVELDGCSAEVTDDGVRLTWATSSERDNVGFQLRRHRVARNKAADFELVNSDVILAEGSDLAGADYEFVDTTPLAPGRYLFVLEDIDVNGTITQHEPIELVIEGARQQHTRTAPRRTSR